MTIEQRLEAVTMNLELAARDIQDLHKAVQVDAGNIRALARIAENSRTPTDPTGGRSLAL